QLESLVLEAGAVEVVVGLPRSLSGQEGPAAALARRFAEDVARRLDPVPVRLVDERFTTVSATANLRDAGVSAKSGRSRVDQAAAVIILQSALDAERASGRPPGELVGLSSAAPTASEQGSA
ncbi:MAG TPA: Holliday junction resolvase RuvX, partial [Candidatus Limnocylindria bacterium]|nr:Holliday junction resolvase RuvX [Candidatus Limnocylindria bacterium]